MQGEIPGTESGLLYSRDRELSSSSAKRPFARDESAGLESIKVSATETICRLSMREYFCIIRAMAGYDAVFSSLVRCEYEYTSTEESIRR